VQSPVLDFSFTLLYGPRSAISPSGSPSPGFQLFSRRPLMLLLRFPLFFDDPFKARLAQRMASATFRYLKAVQALENSAIRKDLKKQRVGSFLDPPILSSWFFSVFVYPFPLGASTTSESSLGPLLKNGSLFFPQRISHRRSPERCWMGSVL